MKDSENNKKIIELLERIDTWEAPTIAGEITQGDMPGEKIKISGFLYEKAELIFKEVVKIIAPILESRDNSKVVLTVCGGSGVGKSEIASLLSYYFNQMGIGSYTLSGDNYPRRIPKYNDAERLHVFRESALRGMLEEGTYTKDRFEVIHKLQLADEDANPVHMKEYPWIESYLESGKKGLREYLGTSKEIDFDDLTRIIAEFKNGQEEIWLKRMGREDTELWFEKVDFSKTNILIIEWTHGNSDYYTGVDVPILLNSTPQETLEYRKIRNRDQGIDSAFTTLVLNLEQEMLFVQAHKAKIIVSKDGELLSYEEYLHLMEEIEGESNE